MHHYFTHDIDDALRDYHAEHDVDDFPDDDYDEEEYDWDDD